MLRPTFLTVRVTIIIVIRVITVDFRIATKTVVVVFIATITTIIILVKQGVVKVSATILAIVN
jgi:hypothetical protein